MFKDCSRKQSVSTNKKTAHRNLFDSLKSQLFVSRNRTEARRAGIQRFLSPVASSGPGRFSSKRERVSTEKIAALATRDDRGGGERNDRFLKQPQYLTATAQGCGFGATCFPTLRPPPTRFSQTPTTTRTNACTRTERKRENRHLLERLRSMGNCTMPADTPPISEHRLRSTPSLCSTLPCISFLSRVPL